MQVPTQALVERSGADIPVLPLSTGAFPAWLAGAAEREQAWCRAHGFAGQSGRVLTLPGPGGEIVRVLLGLGDVGEGERPDLWSWASLVEALPAGSYALEGVEGEEGERAALAFALGSYCFDRYKDAPERGVRLVWPQGVDRERVRRLVEGQCLARTLVNTPAGDLGPEELAGAARELAQRHGARYREVVGEELLAQNYPAIHAVGRAASRAPRLADFTWGDPTHPSVTLVGKGVVFDSGGLDLKPAEGMKLMKKDMGGAASVLGLAHAVMDAGLPLHLRVLIPCVENAVAGNAFRPLDVLPTRKGITVEVGNTDAEGRLILCDALAEADRDDPSLILDFATLTGAARVALGTELPALFASDEAWAERYLAAGREASDPLWRLPLFKDYRRFLESPVADLSSTSSKRFGGAIAAALFLREFVAPERSWMHVDTMGYNEDARPGRPRGGEAFGLRAAYRMFEEGNFGDPGA